MADIKDVSDVVGSALTEVGLEGILDVEMDGAEAVRTFGGEHRGNDVEVTITVKHSQPEQAS